MNPTKNLIELKIYMNPTKNMIDPKLYINPTINMIEPKLYMNPTKNLIGSLLNIYVSFLFLEPSVSQKNAKNHYAYYPKYPSGSWQPVLAP